LHNGDRCDQISLIADAFLLLIKSLLYIFLREEKNIYLEIIVENLDHTVTNIKTIGPKTINYLWFAFTTAIEENHGFENEIIKLYLNKYPALELPSKLALMNKFI